MTNTVIKVDPNVWKLPTQNATLAQSPLKEILTQIPPLFSINVDPEDLL